MNMKKKTTDVYRKVSVLLILSFIVTMILPASVFADEQKCETVKAAWYEDSYHITGENGVKSGYGYEYEQAVAAYTGWDYDYVNGDWNELFEKLQRGDIDIMAALSYTDERAESILFSELPMGKERYYLYLNLDNTDISQSDLSSLNGKRIAVMEASIQGTQFAQWEDKHNVKTQHIDMDAKKKDVRLLYEADVEHQHIMCDITKVKEVFTNLISNAVKYTSSGGIDTLCAKEIPCDRAGYVRIKTEITDNGIGMSEDYLPLLYDSFTREHNTTTGKVAGTGLGMPIVKKLVDLMGGSIDVESKLGKGTKFTIILEHRIADEAYYIHMQDKISDDAKKEIVKGKHILLAEDNDLNAEIATVILEKMGIIVDRVEDGVQCVAKLGQMPADTYDMILMDIQMPNMDGYKATQEIRHFSDKKKANIPIVAMTANAFEEDKKKAMEQGMNGHIAKPIDADKIQDIMASILKWFKKI